MDLFIGYDEDFMDLEISFMVLFRIDRISVIFDDDLDEVSLFFFLVFCDIVIKFFF